MKIKLIINDIDTGLVLANFNDGYESAFDGKVYMPLWICPSCMNDILDEPDLGPEIDFGTLRVLSEKFETCGSFNHTDDRN